jgi:hypothetical protein
MIKNLINALLVLLLTQLIDKNLALASDEIFNYDPVMKDMYLEKNKPAYDTEQCDEILEKLYSAYSILKTENLNLTAKTIFAVTLNDFAVQRKVIPCPPLGRLTIKKVLDATLPLPLTEREADCAYFSAMADELLKLQEKSLKLNKCYGKGKIEVSNALLNQFSKCDKDSRMKKKMNKVAKGKLCN